MVVLQTRWVDSEFWRKKSDETAVADGCALFGQVCRFPFFLVRSVEKPMHIYSENVSPFSCPLLHLPLSSF